MKPGIVGVVICFLFLFLSLESCNNAVNSGYRYAYPVSIKADSVSIEAPVSVHLQLKAMMDGGCWVLDRVQTSWSNDTTAEMHFLCRHDLSAPCQLTDSLIQFNWPLIVPKPGSYTLHLHYGDQSLAKYTSVQVRIP